MKSLDLTSIPNTKCESIDVNEPSESGTNDCPSNINPSESQIVIGELVCRNKLKLQKQ